MNSPTTCIQSTAEVVFQNNYRNKAFKEIGYTLLFVFSVLLTYAQTNVRAEVDLQDNQSCTAIPVQSYGVILQSTIAPRSGRNGKYKLDYFDKDLVKQKSDSFSIANSSTLYYSFQKDGVNYTLNADNDKAFSLITADFHGYNSSIFNGELPSKTDVYQFVVVGQYLYIRCAISNQNTLLQVNMKTKKQTRLQLHIDDVRRGDLYSRDLQILNNELLVFVQADISNKTSDLYMFKYSMDGKLLKTINLSANIDEKMFDVKTAVIDNKILVSGTFAKTNSDYAQGIFFAELVSDEVVNPKFFNFLQLKNFSTYLTDKAQGAIERKNEKLANKDAELYINTFALVHTVLKSADGYTITCEMYVPNYVSGSLVNYYYTHAVILKLNIAGKLQWDQSIKLETDLGDTYLRQIVATNESSTGDISMSFVKRNTLTTKSMDKNGKVIKEKSLDIKSLSSADTKTRRNISTVDPWYENYFLASGFQRVASKSTKEKKDIYYMNKLSSDN